MFEAVELAEAARKAAGADVTLVSDGELCDAVFELAAARAAVEAAEAHVLAELDVRGATDREFGSPTLWWVTGQRRAPRPAVAARLRLGMQLRHLDVVDEALAEGCLTADHARAIAAAAANPRIADHIVAVQGDLVALAQQCPFRVWRHHLRVVEQLLDQDGSFDPDRELARNQLRVSPNGGDGICLSGELVGEHALSVTQLLEAETDRRWRRARADHDESPDLAIPTRSTLRALALVELLRKGSAGQTPTGNGPLVDLSLVRPADRPAHTHTIDGMLVDPHTTRPVCCDPALTVIDVDDHDNPLRVGRQHRYATPTQRRALAVRDGGCVFPGCDMPVGWTDAHHIQPWEAGGSTDVENLALLCRHHHGVTHRTGWTMTAHPDQTFTWTTPTNRTLTSQRNRGSPDRNFIA